MPKVALDRCYGTLDRDRRSQTLRCLDPHNSYLHSASKILRSRYLKSTLVSSRLQQYLRLRLLTMKLSMLHWSMLGVPISSP